jgi:hypothetical protein
MAKSKKEIITDKPNKAAANVASAIVIVRDTPVIMANDLASFFDTTTKAVNQYRSRNSDKFTSDYAFQMTKEEWDRLKSQNVTSKTGRGGSRTPPWVYTEHGVAMMSMGMKSENAIRLSKVIIDTFVDYRRGTLPKEPVLSGPRAAAHRRSLQEQIYNQIEQFLALPLPSQGGHTVGDELGGIGNKVLEHVKSVLESPSKKNEKISAEVAKILAEAEKIYAETRKLNLEADTIMLENYRARLDFIRELREMAGQLERDDWVEMFDGSFGEADRTLLSAPDKKR